MGGAEHIGRSFVTKHELAHKTGSGKTPFFVSVSLMHYTGKGIHVEPSAYSWLKLVAATMLLFLIIDVKQVVGWIAECW